VLIFLAVALLIVLPSPWSFIAFFVLIPIWVLELFGWSRTVKRHRKAVGVETLIGQDAVVITACRPTGQVQLNGEIWEARCDAGAGKGETVRVVGREKLTLVVMPADTAPAPAA